MKFTPLSKHAIANHRLRKSSITDASLQGKASVEHGTEAPKILTIKSRLAETIRFPNTSSLGTELPALEFSLLRDKPVDSIRRFSEMYQWLKERLQESSFIDQEVLLIEKGIKLTADLADLILECESPSIYVMLKQVESLFSSSLTSARLVS